MNLNTLDRKILYQLDLNARQTNSAIAKKVHASREVVAYRINRLVDKGVINYFVTLINTMKLDYLWFRTFIKFRNLAEESEKEILEYILKRVSWAVKVGGNWDLNMAVFSKDVYEFRDFINDLMERYGNYIERHWTSVVTRMWHYSKGYLIGKEEDSSPFRIMGIGKKDSKTVKLSKTDYRILHALLTNARKSSVSLAKDLRLTERVVRYGIKSLIKNGVIIGFRPFLNLDKIGYLRFKAHYKLKNVTEQRKRALMRFAHLHPNIVYVTEAVGGADWEVEFEVTNNEHLYRIFEDIRNRFSDIIKDYEFMQYVKEYKFTYLP